MSSIFLFLALACERDVLVRFFVKYLSIVYLFLPLFQYIDFIRLITFRMLDIYHFMENGSYI